LYEDLHIYCAYGLLALIVIHIGAASWHHFIRRDRVAARMLDGKAG
jgi:cytochrome b561